MGLPGLNDKDVEKLRVGNCLYFAALRLVRAALLIGAVVLFENPMTSRVWLAPALQKLARRHNAVWAKTHFCQYGMPWRKATYFLTFNADGLDTALKKCHAVGGRCSAIGRKHIILQSTDPTGVFMTLRAQPYPSKLCSAIAEHVTAHLSASNFIRPK